MKAYLFKKIFESILTRLMRDNFMELDKNFVVSKEVAQNCLVQPIKCNTANKILVKKIKIAFSQLLMVTSE